MGVVVLRRSHAGPVLPHQGGAEWAIVEVVLELPHHAGDPGQGPAPNTAQQAGQLGKECTPEDDPQLWPQLNKLTTN